MARPVLDPGLAEKVRATGARERTLPLHPELHGCLGVSLQRGITVAVTGAPAAAASVSLQLAAGPSAAGSWACAVGMPDLGLVSAAEVGIALDRFALIPRLGKATGPGQATRPGVGWGPHAPEEGGLGRPPGQKTWGEVVASVIDGFDVVLARPPAHLEAGVARRLVARARERGAVLVGVGGWPEGASLRIEVSVTRWEGLDPTGAGHLSGVQRRLSPTGRLSSSIRRDFASGSPAGRVRGVRSA